MNKANGVLNSESKGVIKIRIDALASVARALALTPKGLIPSQRHLPGLQI